MALTPKQLRQIQEIIRKRMLRFTYDVLGDRALTSEELKTLKDAGLLSRGTRAFIGDAHLLGKVAALIPYSERGRLSYDAALKSAKAMRFSLTDVEKKAIEYAESSAGEYIKGLTNDMVRDANALTARAAGDVLRTVQDGVSQAIAKRQARSELKTQLFQLIDNRSKDWMRIAHTELNNAIQNAVYHEIREKSEDGVNQLVFRRPNPDACKPCKKLYLKADGITPRVFKLSELEDSNVGRKQADWQPVLGSTHPWCSCQTIVLPDGHDFKTRWVAREKFTKNGVVYNAGNVVPSAVYDILSGQERRKVRKDAVLEFTGKTAKSAGNEFIKAFSDEEDDCLCEH